MGRAERKARRSARRARPFGRALLGYRRRSVDGRVAALEATIADLHAAVDGAASPDHRGLVERATRRTAQQMLEAARDEAEAIRAAADSDASAVLADAYELVRARDEPIDLRGGASEADIGSPGARDS